MTKQEIEAMDPEVRHQYFKDYVTELEGDPNKLRAYLGMEVVDADYGYVKIQIDIDERHQNPIGTVHGGVVYALADTCGGACNSTLGEPGPTISADIHYIGNMVGTKRLIGECHVIKEGSRINVLEQKVYNDKGKVVAICTQQYMKTGRDLRAEARAREEKKNEA